MESPISILLLSLGTNTPLTESKYKHLFSHLRSVAVMHRISDPEFARHYLENPSITSSTKAVILTDSGITTQSHQSQLNRNLVKYVKSGGVVIMACEWTYTYSDAEFLEYMLSVWKIGWRHGAATREREDFGVEDVYTRGGKRALKPYNMRAVLLDGVVKDDVLYRGKDPLDVAVAFKKIDEGYLGYIGDVHWADGSTEVVLAMCGL